MNRKPYIVENSDISSFTDSKVEQSMDKYSEDFYDDKQQDSKKEQSVSYKDDFESQSKISRSSFTKPKVKIIDEDVYSQSIGESMNKTEYSDSKVLKGKPLQTIKQQTKTKPNQVTIQKQLQPPVKKQKLSQKQKLKLTAFADQKYLPYNFNRLKQIQKQRILTDLVEENNKCKQQIRRLQEQVKSQKVKFSKLLQQKVSQYDDSKEKVLFKQNQALKTRIESLLQFKKTHDLNNTFKALSTTHQKPSNFQEQKIKQQLIGVIDKLKKRLRESEEQLKVLQRKIQFNQELDIQQSLSNKARQLEKLQYKLAQLNEQAQTDRLFIDQLKQKISRTDGLLKQERQKYSKLTKEFRSIELKISTNNDMVKELAQVRRERDGLQKSLRELSGSLLSKVEAKNKEQKRELEALGYIQVMDFGN